MSRSKLASSLLLAMWVAAPAAYPEAVDAITGPKAANVDAKRLLAAGDDEANWLSYGRTYDEQRFSPLTAINDKNIGKLGLQWSADMDTARGQEATPIVVDGVLYISTAWSMVKAFDAATGKLLWSYDPEVPREKLVDVCCDAVNRGVAVYNGKVFVGTDYGNIFCVDVKDRSADGWAMWGGNAAHNGWEE